MSWSPFSMGPQVRATLAMVVAGLRHCETGGKLRVNSPDRPFLSARRPYSCRSRVLRKRQARRRWLSVLAGSATTAGACLRQA